jgi:hypothetical protein
MLGKLIQYDIRSTWREFAGVYLSILLGVLILPPLFSGYTNQFVNTIAGFVAAGIIIATIVVMVITLFRIFNTNVYSREGYLTLTLPVTSSQIVFSKLLVSTMWIILTGIVSVIGICVFILNMQPVQLSEITDGIRKIMGMLDSRGTLAIALMILAMLVSTVKEIAKLFLACSIAHLKQIGRFRVAIGIFSYFVLSWMETLVVQAVTLIASFIPGIETYVTQLDAMNDMASIQQAVGLFNGILGFGILYALLLTAAFSVGNIWLLNHKLDLD